MIARVRLFLVLGFMLPLTIFLMPVQYLAIKLNLGLARRLPVVWHRLMTSMIGLKITRHGKFAKNRPLMLVANHVSWCDILVLGSLGEVCFIAKNEVATTPFAGLLARLQRSVFVVREEKRKSGQQAREVTERLKDGDTIVLFAEGTTGDGNRILEFKSSLFGAAQYALEAPEIDAVYIQPVSIAYTRLHGMRMGRIQRARASWPGDIELAPHASEFMKTSAWDIEVSLGEPLVFDQSTRRRTIAKQVQGQVRDMFLMSNYDRM
ncbi:MAG: lysophospholipid acyltransferase family protein [Rhizobiaceae bacterium]|nr:lysophospholipid acyltransferase family protein [Rhizobiaceae bacterium]